MSDLDDIMSRNPFDLSSLDLDQAIGAVRKHRALLTSGVKPKREGKGDGPKIDLAAIGLLKKPEVAPISRRRVT